MNYCLLVFDKLYWLRCELMFYLNSEAALQYPINYK